MPTLGLGEDVLLRAWPTSGRVGILDLEYTAWEGSWQRNWSGPDEWREIVQLGFQVVDGATFHPQTASVECMVRPQRNALLSDYFIKLTGISQDRLESSAVPFAEAVTELAAVADVDLILFNGNDGEILRENCALNGITPPLPDGRQFNFRPLLAASLERGMDELTSSRLPSLAGIPSQGRAHTALDDCRAIAAAFATWRKQGKL